LVQQGCGQAAAHLVAEVSQAATAAAMVEAGGFQQQAGDTDVFGQVGDALGHFLMAADQGIGDQGFFIESRHGRAGLALKNALHALGEVVNERPGFGQGLAAIAGGKIEAGKAEFRRPPAAEPAVMLGHGFQPFSREGRCAHDAVLPLGGVAEGFGGGAGDMDGNPVL